MKIIIIIIIIYFTIFSVVNVKKTYVHVQASSTIVIFSCEECVVCFSERSEDCPAGKEHVRKQSSRKLHIRTSSV